MTSQTPAGWYPDPGQVPDGPRTERWWDGSRWTDQTRPATTPPPLPPQTAAPAPAVPAQQPPAPGMIPTYGNYPVYTGQLPPKPRNRARIAIAAAVAVVVLAGVVGGVYALTSDDGGNNKAGSESQQPKDPQRPDGPGGGSGGSGGDDASPEAPGSPRAPLDEGYATDIVNGVALPVLDGWTGSDGAGGAGVQTGTYKCPDDVEQSCVKGGASVSSAEDLKLDGTTAEAAAKEDILKNAQASYGGDVYGGIVQHDELLSEKVTVAGQQGYRVRWNVDTKSKIDAWVESVAFPSPGDSKSLVVVRIGVDIPRTSKEEAAGPDNTSIDKLVKGIKKASVTGGATGGNGQDV
ncbi:DUF2510 domain-containing protein [Streptomyces kunmingensis]|uniref:DUF2510 domain-containing protein n=1 Tax=Streptomyces kunmingensis TaxID=68225 RepID=A0ABU6CCB8_9ACTN|nr:DUF2510 domain-containing protein [Streptomyces kunmingensis]MEB3962323.1 DUF2510 domain-containing protein [Streptomyces kunmingensis]